MHVLALSGGGIRGYIQALVLAALESRLGKPLCAVFDLIIGTSTGGALGAGLALGKSAADMVDFYLNEGPRIFRRSLGKRLRSVCGLFDEAYDAAGLEQALDAVFDVAALSQVKTRLCLTAYDIEGRRPVLFKSWKAQADPREDHLLAAIIRASAAAPTYFEPTLIKSATGLMRACVDGGVYANNPALCGLVEALKLEGSTKHIRLLSVGTGCDERPYLLTDARRWGLAGWARPMLDMLFSAQSDIAGYQCDHILGDKYVELQPTFGEPIPMDATDAKAFSTMEFYAGRIIDGRDMVRAVRLVGAA